MADKLPRMPILALNIVARMAAVHRDVKELSERRRREKQSLIPSEETDRKFARNVRIVLIDRVIAECFDDPDNFALLGERYERACELRRQPEDA